MGAVAWVVTQQVVVLVVARRAVVLVVARPAVVLVVARRTARCSEHSVLASTMHSADSGARRAP
jgi:hypothetical protein